MVTFDLLLFSRRLLSCAVAGRVFLQTCCKRMAERWTMETNTGGGDDAEITHIPVGLICHNENYAPVC